LPVEIFERRDDIFRRAVTLHSAPDTPSGADWKIAGAKWRIMVPNGSAFG